MYLCDLSLSDFHVGNVFAEEIFVSYGKLYWSGKGIDPGHT